MNSNTRAGLPDGYGLSQINENYYTIQLRQYPHIHQALKMGLAFSGKNVAIEHCSQALKQSEQIIMEEELLATAGAIYNESELDLMGQEDMQFDNASGIS